MGRCKPVLVAMAAALAIGSGLARGEPARQTPQSRTPALSPPDLPSATYGADGLAALPTGPFAEIGPELFATCDGEALRHSNPGGVLLCMGEHLNARCGADRECRRAVHQWVAAVLRY
jgi:hypothetical protein